MGLIQKFIQSLIGLSAMTLCEQYPLTTPQSGRVNEASKSKCSTFINELNLPDAIILSASYLPADSSLDLTGTHPSCPSDPITSPIDVCRLALSVSTSESSETLIEAWLPLQSWNGRLLSTGTGGIAGCVDYETMVMGSSLGFATFGTNAGHNGSEGYEWALNQPESLIDFGGRSIHVEAIYARELSRQFYGEEGSEQPKSYFAGCSSGGRQGISTAIHHPEDFDGVLAGAPGVDWLQTISFKGILAQRVGRCDPGSPRRLSEEQWKAVINEEIRVCDPIDGIVDGVVDDPTKCVGVFDPKSLACGSGVLDESLCLSADQVASVNDAYQPIRNSKGDVVFPSFELGADGAWFSSYPASYSILTDFFTGAIYNTTSWSPCPFTAEDMDFAVSINPGNVHTDESDLGDFKAVGGKLLVYHGRSDQANPSSHSQEYFHRVQKSLGLTMDQMLDFYRIFWMEGMHHCGMGPGAWNIAQTGTVPEMLRDSRHSALLALVQWVESGVPPNELVGTKYVEDDVGKGISAQRVHCAYPNVSKWDGEGDTTLETSWKCV